MNKALRVNLQKIKVMVSIKVVSTKDNLPMSVSGLCGGSLA